jgi:phosphoribosylformylglycinamidine synthase
VHDGADGGVGLALAEMAVASGVGVEAQPPEGADHRWLFAESPSQFVLCVDAAELGTIESRCEAAGIPVTVLGKAGGSRLSIGRLVDVALADAVATWRGRLPQALAQGTTQG